MLKNKDTLTQCSKKVNRKSKLIVILGPTASGKSDLAVKLAKSPALSKIEGFNGEIVCADSRQVYRGMSIGTASPSLRSPGLPVVIHHLFNFVEPNKPLNVATYKKMAIKTIKDIQKRGKMPFLVGGTGLYVKAIVDNLKFPKMEPNAKLRKELEQKTAPQLFGIYKKLDKKGALQIDKNNKRRLIRAIEVCKITGEPFWTQRQKAIPLFDILQIGINAPKTELEKRIKKRTEKMFKQGLEKEVKKLVKKYGWTPVLQNTIGYSEWRASSKPLGGLDFPRSHSVALTASHATKKELQELISLHTIQYAKRQMTWFKKNERILWVKNYQEAARKVLTFLND
ncbi:MAG: tRNA (adenosine(37)-N6)-dimethylallyltransferase MiaA [Candidatus Pacebacteria bacterium]|nr:tRNA (adenosine(37)-N6)-dimethylallyltransferase MiaA [Candidatus Paceibacterota bacterium]